MYRTVRAQYSTFRVLKSTEGGRTACYHQAGPRFTDHGPKAKDGSRVLRDYEGGGNARLLASQMAGLVMAFVVAWRAGTGVIGGNITRPEARQRTSRMTLEAKKVKKV